MANREDPDVFLLPLGTCVRAPFTRRGRQQGTGGDRGSCRELTSTPRRDQPPCLHPAPHLLSPESRVDPLTRSALPGSCPQTKLEGDRLLQRPRCT